MSRNDDINDDINDVMNRDFENLVDNTSNANISDVYLRKDGNDQAEKPNGMDFIEEKKAIVQEIISTLCCSGEFAKTYSPIETVKAIQKYIHREKPFGRILYSQITSAIFALDKTSGVDINGNLELLIDYIRHNLENDTEYNKLIDFVMRIYDHVQLAEAQKKVIRDATEKSKEEIKLELENTSKQVTSDFSQKLNDEARASQRGYVATLGIFASIMVAIFSNLSLTKSIMDNFHEGLLSIILLSTMAGTFVIIILHMLLSAIGNMVDKKIEGLDTKNYVFGFWLISFICLVALAKVGN